MDSELSLKSPTVNERLSSKGCWYLSGELFGGRGCDIFDFEIESYVHFIDNVTSLGELRRGLQELSPLADDALAVALLMDNVRFATFKISLIAERIKAQIPSPLMVLDTEKMDTEKMPEQFYPILIPQSFIKGVMIADNFGVPLGAALVRIEEVEGENKISSPVRS
jgi:hypothetical protein